MSHIIIDGYNLIGTAHNNLEKEREELIQALSQYAKIKGQEITVVFDGWKDGRGHETATISGGIRIIYSGLGERADRVIMRIINEERKAWIVITSDREIADYAYAREMSPVSSEDFEDRLVAALTLSPPPPLIIPSGKRSKREKLRLRGLNKL